MKLDELKDIVPLTPEELDTYRSYPIQKHHYIVYEEVLSRQQRQRDGYSSQIIRQFRKLYAALF